MEVIIDMSTSKLGAKTSRRNPWIILGLLFLLTVITFIARQTLSILAPVLRAQLDLTNGAYGRIVSALSFGMMVGEFPVGSIIDRLGSRIGISLVACWWTAATGALVFANTGMQFSLVQFWRGTGACGVYSGGIKTVTKLFTQKDRTLAIGIFNGGSVIGATLAPPVIIYLLHNYGISVAFLAPTFAALFWIPLWWITYTEESDSITADSAVEASLFSMLGNSSSWAIMTCRFFIGPVMQFYWYWIPSFFFSARHMTMMEIGILAWVPFLMVDVGGIAGGWAASMLIRRGYSILSTRRILMFGSASVCLLSYTVPLISSTSIMLLMLSITIASDNFLSAHMFAAVTDLFPSEHVGKATGLTGVAGGLSGMLFPLLTGILVDKISYKPVFALVGMMPLIGTILLFTFGQAYTQDRRLYCTNRQGMV